MEITPTGEKLKEKLKRAGLSYRKAAPLVHCSYSYLSDILNGRRLHPGYALRLRLDAVLDDVIADREATNSRGGETRHRG